MNPLLQPAPTGLADAGQQRDVAGALQSLLLDRVHTGNEAQALTDQRQSALQQYQQMLLQPASNIAPTVQGAYGWLSALGQGKRGFDAAASGIAAGGKALVDQDNLMRNSQIAAAQAGYTDAREQDNFADKELMSLRGGLKGVGTAGGMEKILPLYRGIFNSFSQQAKDMQFATPAERTAWIKGNTDEAVKSALTQFGIAVSPAVLNSLDRLSNSNDENGVVVSANDNARRNGLIDDKQTASTNISSTSQPDKPDLVFPGKTPAEVRAQAELLTDPKQKAELLAALDAGTPIRQNFGSPELDRSKFSQGTPPGTPPFKNTPNEKLMNSTSEAMGKSYADDYNTMRESAASAGDQIDAFRNLQKLEPNTNSFANAQGYIGVALDAMGIDSKSPIVQNAIKNREANTILSQMRNAALRGEKGVQTRSDEIRIADEFAKTSDPSTVWKYLTQLGMERAQRKVEALKFADEVKAQNNGAPIEARTKFLKAIADDPLTQIFHGKLIFRTPTIEAFMRKYPDATQQEAVDYWRSLERSYKDGRR